MPIESHNFSRAAGTKPHYRSLVPLIRPLLPPGIVIFGGEWQEASGTMKILFNSLEGINFPALQTAVDAAPEHDDKLDAKIEVDEMRQMTKAAFLVVLDQFNILRVLLNLPPGTPAQFLQQIKNKIDEMG